MHSGSSPMAAVFIFAMMTLTLLPYTVWLYYREPPPEQEVKLWKVIILYIDSFAIELDGTRRSDPTFHALQRTQPLISLLLPLYCIPYLLH